MFHRRAVLGHIDVDRLVGGGQVLVHGECWPSCTEKGRRSTATFTHCFVEFASRQGGRATTSRSAAAGGSATSAHGLLGGGSGGSDAAGVAAAWLTARFAVRRCGAHSPSRQLRQVGAAPSTFQVP